MNTIKKLIKLVLNRETILYLVCGVLTTVVSLVALKLATILLGEKLYLVSNTFSWICAVTFAYIVNKLLVFESKSWKRDVLKKEIPSFLVSRIASYFIEQGGLWLFMSPLKFEGQVFDFKIIQLSGLMIAKIIVGFIVVAINYVLSKFVIFKKESEEKDAD